MDVFCDFKRVLYVTYAYIMTRVVHLSRYMKWSHHNKLTSQQNHVLIVSLGNLYKIGNEDFGPMDSIYIVSVLK